MSAFKLVMISAGFEHGGNVTHRHLDGHSQLLVYPFESQLGNRTFSDFLASVERVQYRYPEFPEGLSADELYEQVIDEELKTFLRKRNGSKFRDVELQLAEADRLTAFRELLGQPPHARRAVIEALFRSTFAAWTNYYTDRREGMTYVGYSPVIAIDADRMVKDFPDIRIAHILRNPFSAYRDTKRRPFPQPINRYLITWNIYHSTMAMHAGTYPDNVRLFRYEDLVRDKKSFMTGMAEYIGVKFEESMLYPSWNGKEIAQDIAPWGTVLESTEQYNKDIISDLSAAEKRQIAIATAAVARHFRYDEIDYLQDHYRVE
jgi:hypothetical protein